MAHAYVYSLSWAYPKVPVAICQLWDEVYAGKKVQTETAKRKSRHQRQAAVVWSRFGSHLSRRSCKSFGRMGLAT